MILLRRIILWGVPGVLVAALVWSLLPRGGTLRGASSHAGDAPPSPPSVATTTPSGSIRMGNLAGTDARGRTRWRIDAAGMVLEEGTQVVQLRGIHATFYDPDGTTMTVTADRGRYGITTQDISLAGNVRGLSSTQREVFADSLDYSAPSGEVTGAGHVRVVEGQVITYADRMVSNLALRRTRFFGKVRMAVR